MSKITRYNGNLQAFGINAVDAERTVFGDAGTQSNDITDNVTTEFLRGWGNIPTGGKPTKQDFNGVLFAATQMIAYLHQMGTPEYNASQEYHVGSRCVGSDSRPYRSITSPNIGNNPVTDGGTNWVNDTDGLQTNIDNEAAARISADNTHAALTNPHSATATPTGSRIAMYNSSSQLSTADASAVNNSIALGQVLLSLGNKYIRIPCWNGSQKVNFLIHWGSYTSSGTGYALVTFNQGFADVPYIFTSYNRSTSAGDYRSHHTPTTTTFYVGYDNGTTNWIAFGQGIA